MVDNGSRKGSTVPQALRSPMTFSSLPTPAKQQAQPPNTRGLSGRHPATCREPQGPAWPGCCRQPWHERLVWVLPRSESAGEAQHRREQAQDPLGFVLPPINFHTAAREPLLGAYACGRTWGAGFLTTWALSALPQPAAQRAQWGRALTCACQATISPGSSSRGPRTSLTLALAFTYVLRTAPKHAHVNQVSSRGWLEGRHLTAPARVTLFP